MSKVTKRKHVMKEMDIDFFDPPAPNQQIVRIICSRGNNLHEVESTEPIPITVQSDEDPETNEVITTDRFLVSMPTKFRKNVWVKRGDFVIVEPIEEGDKVKGEIVRILTPQQIKQFTKDGIWPEKFTTKDNSEPNKTEPDECSEHSDTESDSELFRNPNHNHPTATTESSDEDSDDEDESPDDNN